MRRAVPTRSPATSTTSALDATADDVVTSAQSAAHILADQLAPESRVLIVGTESLAAEIAAVGLRPVRLFDDEPHAVVQGHSPKTGWSNLAEAGAGHPGRRPVGGGQRRPHAAHRTRFAAGHGSMVAALKTATEAEPQVAGKPSATLMRDALARGSFRRPLVVGDRLDTDIACANAAALPSLLVLTGVNCARDAVHAVPEQRPTYIGCDLRSLHQDADELAVATQPAWHIEAADGSLTVRAAGDDQSSDGLSVVRAVADALWSGQLNGQTVTVRAGDDTAHDALQRWSLA